MIRYNEKNFRCADTVSCLTTIKAINPATNAPPNPENIPVEKTTSLSSKIPAASVTGKLRRKENLKASVRFIPTKSAPMRVKPLRDIPGNTEIAWKIPIINASV